eukprot:TRINITY_DN12159_c0_g3_i1.p2 TRINITY_DN12159_c0_g3~~TRINITY_DN12159_c0_g3_i1.p2  ORF type:complete len:293 (+),score=3.41 TRINITY_DN12159_c0_g3_i1:54-932(+)
MSEGQLEVYIVVIQKPINDEMCMFQNPDFKSRIFSRIMKKGDFQLLCQLRQLNKHQNYVFQNDISFVHLKEKQIVKFVGQLDLASNLRSLRLTIDVEKDGIKWLQEGTIYKQFPNLTKLELNLTGSVSQGTYFISLTCPTVLKQTKLCARHCLISFRNAHDVMIEDSQFDGVSFLFSSTKACVRNLYVQNTQGIQFWNCSGVLLDSVTIDNANFRGFSCDNCSNVQVNKLSLNNMNYYEVIQLLNCKVVAMQAISMEGAEKQFVTLNNVECSLNNRTFCVNEYCQQVRIRDI